VDTSSPHSDRVASWARRASGDTVVTRTISALCPDHCKISSLCGHITGDWVLRPWVLGGACAAASFRVIPLFNQWRPSTVRRSFYTRCPLFIEWTIESTCHSMGSTCRQLFSCPVPRPLPVAAGHGHAHKWRTDPVWYLRCIHTAARATCGPLRVVGA
jgi:hypothetical protein